MIRIFLMAALSILLGATAMATVPDLISYQGQLRTGEGDLVPDGSYELTFRIYNVPTEGTPLWVETQSLAVAGGLFNARLGSVAPLSGLAFADQYWLGVQVGEEGELVPRMPLSASPYALTARRIEPDVLSSIDGVVSDEGNVDLVAGENVTITPDDAANTITISATPGAGISGSGTTSYVPRFTASTTLGNSAMSTTNGGAWFSLADGSLSVDLHAATLGHGGAFRSFSADKVGVWVGHEAAGVALYSQTTSDTKAAAFCYNYGADGTALIGAGNNLPGSLLDLGSGIAGTGSYYGVYGKGKATSGSRGGAYFEAYDGPYARVAYHNYLGLDYKIQGTGTVSTVMSTSKGEVSLVAPESPEAWFQDFGSGSLAGGRAVVELEPTFLECVTLQEPGQLRVFLTFTSPPPERYHIEKGPTGFTVVALGSENLEASFDYFVSARWKGWEKVRFAAVDPRPLSREARPVGYVEAQE